VGCSGGRGTRAAGRAVPSPLLPGAPWPGLCLKDGRHYSLSINHQDRALKCSGADKFVPNPAAVSEGTTSPGCPWEPPEAPRGRGQPRCCPRPLLPGVGVVAALGPLAPPQHLLEAPGGAEPPGPAAAGDYISHRPARDRACLGRGEPGLAAYPRPAAGRGLRRCRYGRLRAPGVGWCGRGARDTGRAGPGCCGSGGLRVPWQWDAGVKRRAPSVLLPPREVRAPLASGTASFSA